MSRLEIPLFPLNTVLFPEGPLALRVFEARYLDMVSDCLRNDTPFGACLIRSGREVGGPAQTHEVGTLARIADWHAEPGGLLGVVAHGTRRFRILDTEVAGGGLVRAHVETLEESRRRVLPARFRPLGVLLERIFPHAAPLYRAIEPRFEDVRWVAWRLAELLPLELPQKQYFLQLGDPLQRLERLAEIVESMEGV